MFTGTNSVTVPWSVEEKSIHAYDPAQQRGVGQKAADQSAEKGIKGGSQLCQKDRKEHCQGFFVGGHFCRDRAYPGQTTGRL